MANLDLCAGSAEPIYPPGPGRMVTVIPLEITENGTYTAPNGYAYSPITADVSGGDTPLTVKNDVTFYDYDGTVIAGYTADQFASVTALPTNPTHEGLTAQGWNWSLEGAKAYVAEYGKLNIGQMYVTDDGKTRLYLNRVVSGDEVQIPMTVSEMGGATINWGDGTTTVTDSTALKTYSHTYSAEATPVITIEVTSGSVVLGGGGSGIGVTFLRRVEIGDGVTSIGDNAFSGCSSLASATIPDSVTSIGNSAFSGCYSLASITIPDGVTSIGSSAFSNCYSLASITIPGIITSIGKNAFTGCYSLISVTIPDIITSIGNSAFSGCYSLASIIIPDSVTSIGNYAFSSCYSLASIIIPDGVTSIGDYAFSGCSSLASITIPDGVTSIGDSAFSNCYSLASITIPDSVTSIVDYAFSGCYSLASITIPDGVTSIGSSAFSNCYSLASITIPDSVTSIGSFAFASCGAFADCYVNATTPPTLGSNAFSGVYKNFLIHAPASAVDTYKSASGWSNYADHIVAI